MKSEALAARLRARLPAIDAGHRTGPLPAPLDPEALPAISARLGHPVPPLLSFVLTTVANGGFGPGYGMLGLGSGGYVDDKVRTADAACREFRRFPGWPGGLLPLCHLGCGIYHCLDLETEGMTIWEPAYLPASRARSTTALFPTARGLADWLGAWCNGASPGDWLACDPATGRPRLAAMESWPPQRKPRRDPAQPSLFDPD